MGDENVGGEPIDGGDELHFEEAEFDEGVATETACSACNTAIDDAYFQVAGNVMCARCKVGLEQALSGGSGAVRFVKAGLFGFVAAVLGALLYFAIRELTGYEFALVSVVIGLMVGVAVRTGSQRRGGWLYQGLAVLLTYSAIVSTYVPVIWEGMGEAAFEEEVASDAVAVDEAIVAPLPPATTPVAPSELAFDEEPSGLALVVGSVLFFAATFVVAFVVPFMVGFEDPIMLLIIGIGLFEAWRLNKRLVLEITGPHSIGTAPATAVNV